MGGSGPENRRRMTAPRVLVIDDDTALCELLVEYLGDEGFAVETAHDGMTGAAQAVEGRWDLVVLDVMIPRRSGLDVLRDVRRTSAVPVVMLTARGEEVDRIVGLEIGADDYLTKPFGMDELLARMRAALRHQLQVKGERPVFRTGDLSVDLVRRIVKVGEREVKLSPKEYELLRVLVQHAGKVLTHRFLLKELWDELTDAQYLRVYVRQLRQKIETDPERPQFILTETGVGYRLRSPD